MTPALVALYGDAFGLPSLPAIDATFTIRPYCCSSMRGTMARQHRNTPNRLTCRTACHSSGVTSHVRFVGPAMPALLTRMSVRSFSRIVASAAPSTDSGSDDVDRHGVNGALGGERSRRRAPAALRRGPTSSTTRPSRADDPRWRSRCRVRPAGDDGKLSVQVDAIHARIILIDGSRLAAQRSRLRAWSLEKDRVPVAGTSRHGTTDRPKPAAPSAAGRIVRREARR